MSIKIEARAISPKETKGTLLLTASRVLHWTAHLRGFVTFTAICGGHCAQHAAGPQ